MGSNSTPRMNLGGPGWFNDVYDVKVYYNTDKRSIPTSADEDDSTEVCGTLRVLCE